MQTNVWLNEVTLYWVIFFKITFIDQDKRCTLTFQNKSQKSSRIPYKILSSIHIVKNFPSITPNVEAIKKRWVDLTRQKLKRLPTSKCAAVDRVAGQLRGADVTVVLWLRSRSLSFLQNWIPFNRVALSEGFLMLFMCDIIILIG